MAIAELVDPIHVEIIDLAEGGGIGAGLQD
jgi:hypothetical protein